MIRCGRPRWDAKDKICDWDAKKKQDVCAPAVAMPSPTQKDVCVLQIQPQQQAVKQTGEAALKKTETDLALERLLAERKKLDNFWSQ
jgi:hypothetical protein